MHTCTHARTLARLHSLDYFIVRVSDTLTLTRLQLYIRPRCLCFNQKLKMRVVWGGGQWNYGYSGYSKSDKSLQGAIGFNKE